MVGATIVAIPRRNAAYNPNGAKRTEMNAYITHSTSRFARWRLRPSKFDFAVIHCAGITHQATVVLFRLPRIGESHAVLDDYLSILAVEAPHSCLFDPAKQNASQDGYIPYGATCEPSDNVRPSENRIVAEQATDSYSFAATLYVGAFHQYSAVRVPHRQSKYTCPHATSRQDNTDRGPCSTA